MSSHLSNEEREFLARHLAEVLRTLPQCAPGGRSPSPAKDASTEDGLPLPPPLPVDYLRRYGAALNN